MKNIVLITTLLISALFFGCAKDEFGVNKINQTKSAGSIDSNTATQCSSFTLIKPHVDFLFLWDNSSSQFNMGPSLKKALNTTITKVSERFDYRIVVAPIKTNLNTYQGYDDISLVAENPKGLTPTAQARLRDKGSAINLIDTMVTIPGSDERTYERTKYLLKWAKDQNIFRQDSYLIVVVMSNGDDKKNGAYDLDVTGLKSYARIEAENMYNYAISTIGANQFRFMTMVPHKNRTACSIAGQDQPSYGYQTASNEVNKLAGHPSSDASPYADSYDICGGDYTYIFNGVNNSIEDTLIKHVYTRWPVIERSYITTPPPFDPDKIRVTKLINGIPTELEEGVDWEYAGFKQNYWTRKRPTIGEATTGYFINLLTNKGKVTYPECLVVDTQDLADCYQYLQLQSKPNTSSMALKINGININESTSNG
ncbi:MAG: hypothetical protein KAG61_03970, partial [Bacteriovoracaceae bacterium]|nr:hypothetical protein [Bacteriovoracaceae bacterium]